MIPTLVVALVILAINIIALGLVPKRRRPSSAMAWLLLILLVPFFGLLAFVLIGSPHVPRKRREEQRAAGAVIQSSLAAIPALPASPDRPDWLDSAMVLNRRLGWLPTVQNNSAELFANYEQSIQAMADLVRTAERYVHVEYFIVCWDSTTAPFFDALQEVVARGVKVRLLYDHVSTLKVPGYKEMLAKFDRAGFEWHPMLPIQPLKGNWRRPDLRNHRKILVVDGRTGFLGSQNMIEPGYDKDKNHAAGREWVELTTRVIGPAVAALNAVFATDWYSETDEVLREEIVPWELSEAAGDLTCQVIPSGPGFVSENNLRAFTTLIYSAQRRVSLTSPYF